MCVCECVRMHPYVSMCKCVHVCTYIILCMYMSVYAAYVCICAHVNA